jgi:hypothetical protein
MWKLFIEVLSGHSILLGVHVSKGTEFLEDGKYDYNEISLGLIFISFRFARYIKSTE